MLEIGITAPSEQHQGDIEDEGGGGHLDPGADFGCAPLHHMAEEGAAVGDERGHRSEQEQDHQKLGANCSGLARLAEERETRTTKHDGAGVILLQVNNYLRSGSFHLADGIGADGGT